MIDTILHDRYQIRDLLTQKAGRSTFLALDLQSPNLVIYSTLNVPVTLETEDSFCGGCR